MAQIDSSIPLGVKPFQMPDQVNALARMLEMKNLQQTGEANQLKVAEYRSGVERKNRLAEVLAKNYGTPEEREGALMQGGFLDEYSKLSKDRRENLKLDSGIAKDKKDAEKIDFDNEIKKVEHISSILSTARDPASYEAARQLITRQFPQSAANLPPQFDPGSLQALIAQGQTITQRLADMRAKEGQQITIRGQDIGAETTRRGQDISASTTIRGQNLTDARSRDLIAQGKVPPGYRMKPDGTLEAVPGGPAALGKALPTKLVTDLTEQAGVADTTDRLNTTFKDDYAGKTILGDWSNTYKRIAGDDTGQSQWWQDYALHESTVRNRLFGASLTPGEQGQWMKLTVTPRMDAKEAKTNLQRRAEIERRGLERLTSSTAKAGYNKDQIEALTGRPAGGAPASAPAPAAGGLSPQEQKELQELRQRFKK